MNEKMAKAVAMKVPNAYVILTQNMGFEFRQTDTIIKTPKLHKAIVLVRMMKDMFTAFFLPFR